MYAQNMNYQYRHVIVLHNFWCACITCEAMLYQSLYTRGTYRLQFMNIYYYFSQKSVTCSGGYDSSSFWFPVTRKPKRR